MEIMKVFSSFDDYGYEDERLYSVLMGEDELSLFSNLAEYLYSDDDSAGKSALVGAGVAGLGVAGLGAGAYGAKKGLEHLVARAEKGRLSEREAKILKSIKGDKGVKAATKEVNAAKKAYNKLFKKGLTQGGSEQSAELWEKQLRGKESLGAAERAARKTAEGKIKLKDPSKFEKQLIKANKQAEKLAKTLKENKKLAAGIAAGTLAVGAGVGYGAKKLRNRD